MSNEKSRPYLGIHGSTVTEYIQSTNDIPAGAYVTQVDMDSPAMRAGLQSGDVIVGINGAEITSYETLITDLNELSAEDEITLNIKRSTSKGYIDLDIDVTLGTSTK